MKKLIEHTYGGHIYMKIMPDNGRIGEIDVFLGKCGGETYRTSADQSEDQEEREQIINAYKELY